ncbi:MAG: hypothetical protein HKN39_04210 [Flavobacteriales bacterium]|nr:hypothetical protein [Flavobacteriales bacterium]
MGSLDWVEGNWKNPEKNQGELWEKTKEGNYIGRAWAVQANDTIWSESMLVFEENETLFLKIIHPTENNGMPVIFKEVYSSSNKMTFEKRDHDWPHFISYWVEDDILKAHVGSYEKGETQLYFNWDKVK